MKRQMKLRFWLEACMTTLTSALFVITLIWRDWIEIVFKFSPDNGNGSFEWFIVGGLFIVTIGLFLLAAYEWRRAHAAA